MLPQETISQNPNESGVLPVDPEASKVRNRFQVSLNLLQLPLQIFNTHWFVTGNMSYLRKIFENETDDGLTVVFGNVFGLASEFVFELERFLQGFFWLTSFGIFGRFRLEQSLSFFDFSCFLRWDWRGLDLLRVERKIDGSEEIIFCDPEMVLVNTGVGFSAALGENLLEEGVKELFLVFGDGI